MKKDLGAYTLIPAVKLSGTVRIPEDGSILGEYISGYVRACKPGEYNGPQTRFELFTVAGSTSFSINLQDGGPYLLSAYLCSGVSNLYTVELYQCPFPLLTPVLQQYTAVWSRSSHKIFIGK